MRRRWLGMGAALFMTAVSLVAVDASPAAADGCTQQSCAGGTGGGYTVQVTVTLTGDAAPGGGGGTVHASVAPVCYWFDQSANLGGKSIADLAKLTDYKSDTRMGANDAIWKNPPADWWAPYVAQEAAGAHLTAYEPTCQDGNSYSGGSLTMLTAYGSASSPYGLIVTAGAPPQPSVAPKSLIKVAYDNMQLTPPVVDYNPRITATNGGTLVGLPTYFWVTDPLAVGGPSGRRTIRATAAGVWAEVTADNNGLTLTSPGSNTVNCSRAQALTRYGQAGNPCTVVFGHASTAWPVDATTTWKAAYRLSTGQTDALAPKAKVAPGQPVPVGESQAIVTTVH